MIGEPLGVTGRRKIHIKGALVGVLRIIAQAGCYQQSAGTAYDGVSLILYNSSLGGAFLMAGTYPVAQGRRFRHHRHPHRRTIESCVGSAA